MMSDAYGRPEIDRIYALVARAEVMALRIDNLEGQAHARRVIALLGGVFAVVGLVVTGVFAVLQQGQSLSLIVTIVVLTAVLVAASLVWLEASSSIMALQKLERRLKSASNSAEIALRYSS